MACMSILWTFFCARQGGPTSTGGMKDKQLSHDRALKRVTELKNKVRKEKEWNLERAE